MTESVQKMCQTCWVTPGKHRVMGADGRRRWKCNTCFKKASPQRPATATEMLERRLFVNRGKSN